MARQPPRQHPTPRQLDCLKYVGEFIKTRKFSPTYREIADGLGLKSVDGAYRLVSALIGKGWMGKGSGARNIWIIP